MHWVDIGETPPDDKPWLISSRDELARDEAKMESWKADWKKSSMSWPGPNGTLTQKRRWVSELDKADEAVDIFDKMDGDYPEYPIDVIQGIMLDCCPEQLILQLYMPRKRLEELELSDANAAKFLGATEIHRSGYPAAVASWDAYKAWLLELPTANAATDTAAAAATPVLFAMCECASTDGSRDKIMATLESLGLLEQLLCAQAAPAGLTPGVVATRSSQKVSEKVGGNLHFPITQESQACKPPTTAASTQKMMGRISVAFEVLLTACEKKTSKKKSDLEAELEAMVKACGGTKKFLLIPKKKGPSSSDDEDDDDDDSKGSSITSDTHHILWLPSAYRMIDERVRSHCLHGEGESRAIQRRLEKGNTDTGNLKIDIHSTELEAIKDLNGLKPYHGFAPEKQFEHKLCTALALTRVMAYDNYWMHDNEGPEDVARLVTKLGEYWRNVLLKRTDAELGLGYGVGALHDGTASRAALFKFFEALAPRLKKDFEKDYGMRGVKCHFNWVLRKRRSNAEVAAEKAEKAAKKAAKKPKRELKNRL